MPAENFEEEGLEKIPNLALAQLVFQASLDIFKNNPDLKKQIMTIIENEEMTSYYQHVCSTLNWPVDTALVETMKSKNEAKLAELDEKIKDAESILGDTEIREKMRSKANYLSQIGDKEGALAQFRIVTGRTIMLGYRLDVIFHQIRLGFFHMDQELITQNIDKAQSLIDEGGDWDRRNRLKVYKGLYALSVRQFDQAADCLLDAVATFTSYELMDYKSFITYCVLVSMIALKRPDLREKVVRRSEIAEVLHSLEWVRIFLESFYNCRYADFFLQLAGVEAYLQRDRYFARHARYYIREMRILAYAQILDSYQSLSLDSMAKDFGVTVEFIDQELSRFIAAGRLPCKIDQVGGIVETNRPDNKNFQYQAMIKHGDVLLNRVQKLSRVINI